MVEGSDHVRLIELDEFPFEFLSTVAERESWRKEIYRPIYHIHKWWANRLGSIFRGILLGCLLGVGDDLEAAFYQKQDFETTVIFDPFMGSGTTVGEAHKLGCVALGRDINPVACEAVRVALGPLDRRRLEEAFGELAATSGEQIRGLYQAPDEQGRLTDVLYYFWVKWLPCPSCGSPVDLFASRIFARNAYPSRKPEVQICCPCCGGVYAGLHADRKTQCPFCDLVFDPAQGSVDSGMTRCEKCSRTFSIISAVKAFGDSPPHRLYAKLLLTTGGAKRYLAATDTDVEAYQQAASRLDDELRSGAIRVPTLTLTQGYNTKQALNYRYFRWRDFFNPRQLLALGWLQSGILRITDDSTRDAMLTLFSRTHPDRGQRVGHAKKLRFLL
jgi:putative DNA methylase